MKNKFDILKSTKSNPRFNQSNFSILQTTTHEYVNKGKLRNNNKCLMFHKCIIDFIHSNSHVSQLTLKTNTDNSYTSAH